MARPLRIQYPGAIYHVTCRGNEQKAIFKDDADRQQFLLHLATSLHTYSVKLHSYVLMSNHFHLLVETPLGNLSEFMRHFNISYTGYYNRQHERAGHLYQGRYKSILVDKAAYLTMLSRYIHLNPIRIKATQKLPAEQKIRSLWGYPWSSLRGYIDVRSRETLITYSLVLDEYGGDTDKARAEYKKIIQEDVYGGVDIKGNIIGQSVLGTPEFIAWLKETFLKGAERRERPSVHEIYRHGSKDEVFAAITSETGQDAGGIKSDRGDIRRMAMELLYRIGGLKGPEVGSLFGVGYTFVSRERKRLRKAMSDNEQLREMVERIEARLSTVKI